MTTSIKNVNIVLLYLLSAALTCYSYRHGVGHIPVVLTVGSGIALGWLRGTDGNINRAARMLVGWFGFLIVGTLIALVGTEFLVAPAIFFAGLSSMMASAFLLTYPADALMESEPVSDEPKLSDGNPDQSDRRFFVVDMQPTMGTMLHDDVAQHEHGHAMLLAPSSTELDDAFARERAAFAELLVALANRPAAYMVPSLDDTFAGERAAFAEQLVAFADRHPAYITPDRKDGRPTAANVAAARLNMEWAIRSAVNNSRAALPPAINVDPTRE